MNDVINYNAAGIPIKYTTNGDGTFSESVSIASGGIAPAMVNDLVMIDDTGTRFIYRVTPDSPPVWTAYQLGGTTPYTVGANPRPDNTIPGNVEINNDSGNKIPTVDTDLAVLIGEVQASPTANTALDRLKTIGSNTGNIPVKGQALAADSLPVVLPTDQVTALTPKSELQIYMLFDNVANIPTAAAANTTGAWNTYFGTDAVVDVSTTGNAVTLTCSHQFGLPDSKFYNSTAILKFIDTGAISSLEFNCFEGCTVITDLVLDGCINAKNYCLRNNALLKRLSVGGGKPVVTAKNCIDELPSLSTLSINIAVAMDVFLTGSGSLADGLDFNSDSITIAGNSMANSSDIVTANLPNMKVVGNSCLYGCAVMTKAILSSLESAGISFLQNCTSLTELHIESLKNVGANSFAGISGKTITVYTNSYFNDNSAEFAAFKAANTIAVELVDDSLIFSKGAGVVDSATTRIVQASDSVFSVDLQAPANIDGALNIAMLFPLALYKQDKRRDDLFFDTAIVGTGAANYTAADGGVTMTTAAASDAVIRQSKQMHPYFSGSPQFFEITMINIAAQANIVKRVGAFSTVGATTPFDTTRDGFYVESSGGNIYFKVDKAGSNIFSAVKSAWNIDRLDGSGVVNPSGITFAGANFQALAIEYLYLGGTVARFGFLINDKLIWCHQFANANVNSSTFVSSPVQPVRYEIRQTGAGSGSLTQVCARAASKGTVSIIPMELAFEPAALINANVANTIYAIAGVSLNDLRGIVKLAAFYARGVTADDFRITVRLNPTVAGTFTYNAVANTSYSIALGSTADPSTNTVTDGIVLYSKTFTQLSDVELRIENVLFQLGATAAGVPDKLVLCVEPFSAALDVYGGITVQELL